MAGRAAALGPGPRARGAHHAGQAAGGHRGPGRPASSGQPARPGLRQPGGGGPAGAVAPEPPWLPGAGDGVLRVADGRPGAAVPGRPWDPHHRAGGPVDLARLLGAAAGAGAAGGAPAAGQPAAGSPAPAPAGSAGVVYLTFDDGPTPAWTPRVLELLARYRARATFLVLGRSAAAYPELVRQEFAAGHGVGNHTWSHRRLTGLTGEQLAAEVGATSAAIQRATGAPVRCLRPPYAVVDAAGADRVRELGLRLVLWDIDTYDWRGPGAGVIAGRVLGRVRSRDVVLMHDGGGNRGQTVAALEQVLATLSAKGFRFGALCRD